MQELLDKSVEGLEPLKVTFFKAGGEPVEAAIDTDNLTDKSIPLTVPASLEAGDYTITVITSALIYPAFVEMLVTVGIGNTVYFNESRIY